MPKYTTHVDLPADALARYIGIAIKQKERAAAKFTQDYGPSSAAVAEITTELANMKLAQNYLLSHQEPTPIEQEAKRK